MLPIALKGSGMEKKYQNTGIQPVSVFIEKSGFDLRGIISESNWYLWLIAALNAVLVIIIIVVAVRIARK